MEGRSGRWRGCFIGTPRTSRNRTQSLVDYEVIENIVLQASAADNMNVPSQIGRIVPLSISGRDCSTAVSSCACTSDSRSSLNGNSSGGIELEACAQWLKMDGALTIASLAVVEILFGRQR